MKVTTLRAHLWQLLISDSQRLRHGLCLVFRHKSCAVFGHNAVPMQRT